MARGRMISKTLSTSEKRAELHDVVPELAEFCQALYPLLIAHADDWGCLQGDVFTVKHLVDPSSPRTRHEFERALIALHNVGLIVWYEADGKRFIHVTSWFAHQQLKGHESDGRKRTFPAPPENISKIVDFAQSCPNLPKVALTEENRREENLREEEGNATQPPAANAAPPRDGETDGPTDPLADAWNRITAPPIPRCLKITPQRRRHSRARRVEHSLEEWDAVFRRIAGSAFCGGQNDRGWVATFDWAIGSPDVFVKVLEGKYDNRAPPLKPRLVEPPPSCIPTAEETRRRNEADRAYRDIAIAR